MTTYLLTLLIWTLFATILAGMVVLLGMSLVLTWMFARMVVLKRKDRKNREKDAWTRIANPWDGFADKLAASGQKTFRFGDKYLSTDVLSHLAAALQASLEPSPGAAITFEASPASMRIAITNSRSNSRPQIDISP
jgi:hypothetical protein